MKDLLLYIANNAIDAKLKLIRATVTAVNEYTCDVEPLDGDAEVLDVKLRVIENSTESGVGAFPKVGTIVLVLVANETDAYLLHAAEVERILIKQEGFRAEVDATGNLVFNEGSNEGLVKLPVLQQEIAKLNSYLNAIKQTFSTWVPVPSDGGAALKAAMNAALSSQQGADLSNAGNDKIKH
jgi:hypothetical protein